MHACEIAVFTCDGNKDTSQYMLFSNKLPTFIDVLNYRLDVSSALYSAVYFQRRTLELNQFHFISHQCCNTALHSYFDYDINQCAIKSFSICQ